MSTRKKILVLAGVLLVGSVFALLMHDDAKPVGKLSRRDVIEIRAVVTRLAPNWSSFTHSSLRYWPSLARARLTFRMGDITEDSMGGGVTVHPDGTREVNYPFTVRIKASGWSIDSCRVVKRNGRWTMAPMRSSSSRAILFVPSNPVTSADAGIPLLFHAGRH
jgi:hypothetical protein